MSWIAIHGNANPSNTTPARSSAGKIGAADGGNGFPPAPIRSVLKTHAKRSRLIPELGTLKTAALVQADTGWLVSHGCAVSEAGVVFNQSESQLRLETLNGNLTAAAGLGEQLLWDGNRDRRAQAKQVLWSAMVQGSTCALTVYGIYVFRATHGKRHVDYINGRKFAGYRPVIPESSAARHQAVLQGLAWDILYAMRTGVSWGLTSNQRAHLYHDNAKLSTADWAYACAYANQLYQELQTDREAQGLGPFDDTPMPMRGTAFSPDLDADGVLESAQYQRDVQSDPTAADALVQRAATKALKGWSFRGYSSDCRSWPARPTTWHPVIAHYIRHNGVVVPALILVSNND